MGLGSILGTALGGVGGFLVGGPAGAKLGATIGGGIGSGLSSGNKADKLNKRQLQLADERYNAGAPFRSKLAQTAFAIPTQREDLSSIFTDPGNPYAKLAPRPIPLPPPPTMTPQAPIPERPRQPGGSIGGALTGGLFGGGGGPRVPLAKLLASGNGRGLTGIFKGKG
jgi:hypothetical protein